MSYPNLIRSLWYGNMIILWFYDNFNVILLESYIIPGKILLGILLCLNLIHPWPRSDPDRTSIQFVISQILLLICWFHGSSFKGFSIVFPAPWLAKVESSQKSNGMWFFRHFLRHFCSTVAETIGVTINPASFGAKKCSENHIWSYWDDSWSMEPTKYDELIKILIGRYFKQAVSPFFVVKLSSNLAWLYPWTNLSKTIKILMTS